MERRGSWQLKPTHLWLDSWAVCADAPQLMASLSRRMWLARLLNRKWLRSGFARAPMGNGAVNHVVSTPCCNATRVNSFPSPFLYIYNILNRFPSCLWTFRVVIDGFFSSCHSLTPLSFGYQVFLYFLRRSNAARQITIKKKTDAGMAPPVDPATRKRVLKVIFVSLLLDLVRFSFSARFPLPSVLGR